MLLSLTPVTLSLFLTGCGFEPVYGHKTADSNSQTLAGVKIDSMPGRMGQEFKADLEDQLNPRGAVPEKPAYRLSATISSAAGAIGVAPDGTVSRYNVYIDSTYTLYRTSDGKAITSGSVRHVSSYNNLTNEYFSTYTSEEDAVKRGIAELSEIYRARLGAYLAEGAPVQVVQPTKPPGSPLVSPPPLPGQTMPSTAPLTPPPPLPATLLLPAS